MHLIPLEAATCPNDHSVGRGARNAPLSLTGLTQGHGAVSLLIVLSDTKGYEMLPLEKSFTIVSRNGERTTKTIRLLAPCELSGYERIGIAEGTDLDHCLYLARHARNFFERVAGYAPSELTAAGRRVGATCAIAFYEPKKQ